MESIMQMLHRKEFLVHERMKTMRSVNYREWKMFILSEIQSEHHDWNRTEVENFYKENNKDFIKMYLDHADRKNLIAEGVNV